MGEQTRVGAKWLIAGKVSGQALEFAIGIVLARLLIPGDFGLIVTIQIFTGFVGLVAGGGMGQALVQSKEVTNRDFHVVFTMQLLIGCVIFLSFFFISPWFAKWFDNPAYSLLLPISAISFLVRPFLNIHASWLHREMRFRTLSVNNLIISILSGSVSITMALAGMGAWSLILSGLISSLINTFLLSYFTSIRPRLCLDRGVIKKLGSYGVKVTLNDLIHYFVRKTNNLIITLKAGPAMVGLFNKADSLGRMPVDLISSSVYMPVFRAMSQIQENLDQTRYLFHKMMLLLIIYTLPFYILIAWIADPFIPLVYGEKWRAVIEPLEVFGFIGLLYCIGHPCGAVLAAQNRLGREVIVHLTQWILLSIACYIGLSWGLRGVAWGYFLSQVYATFFMLMLVKKTINVRLLELFKIILPGLFLNAILVIVLVLINIFFPFDSNSKAPILYILMSVFGGGLAYILAFFFLPLKSIIPESNRWKEVIRGLPRF